MSRKHVVPLPKNWPQHVKSAVIHTISLATTAFIATYGGLSRRKHRPTQTRIKLDLAHREIALLKEEMRLKDARFSRVPSHRRPYYRPIERLQILKLKAARVGEKTTAAVIGGLVVADDVILDCDRRRNAIDSSAIVAVTVPNCEAINNRTDGIGAINRQRYAIPVSVDNRDLGSLLAREDDVLVFHENALHVGTGPDDDFVEIDGRVHCLLDGGKVVWHVDGGRNSQRRKQHERGEEKKESHGSVSLAQSGMRSTYVNHYIMKKYRFSGHW